LVHDVSGVLTHSLGTVHVSVLGVADAAAGLGLVPLVVTESGGVHGVFVSCVADQIVSDSSVVSLFNVCTLSVSGTIVGTLRALTRLSFVSIETDTLTIVTITNSSVGAFSIFVM